MLTMYLIGCALALAWFGFISEISDCMSPRDIALLWSLEWGAISVVSLMTPGISPMQALNWALVGGIHIAFLAYYFGQICELRNDHQDPA